MKKEIWPDILKAIGILAVILGHLASPFSQFIYAWHMPLFFVLSGFFIKVDGSFKSFCKKKVLRLILPYFIFSFVGLGVEIVKRVVLHRSSLNIIDELLAVFVWMDEASLHNTYAFVLWFLSALFIAQVIVFILLRYVPNRIVQFLIVAVLWKLSFYVNLPFALDNGMQAALFFLIGNYIYKYNTIFHKTFIFFAFVWIFLWSMYGLPTLNLAEKSYSNPVIVFSFSLSIILFLTLFAKKVQNINWIQTTSGFIAGETMILFIVHPYTNNVAHLLLEYVQCSCWYIKFLTSLIILIPIVLFKRRYKELWIFKYV